ncbi:MAG TPA: thioredoxin domain-containing protein [Micromonosporaceae bacterium]|nr:thioredoxin domain-containing protein [Micromonosporaceae bacterium]
MNRLADATSPYLLQHADNPVEWWPWSAEAFEEARRRDVPVMISVGYAACHWCHVMAHESFEDPAIADEINRKFVAIKVDREERPDVDAVYMTATQALTGQGGWPMTVFATPTGEPFFAGTYYPPPVFTRLLDAIDTAWRDQRDEVVKQSTQVVTAITAAQHLGAEGGLVGAEALAAGAASLEAEFDEVYGGFGGAPKFPPHLVMLFLLRHFQRTGDVRSLEMVRATAEQMARGGIYDQLAGGFARYAVDETWTVPHFEKMLYDNALLLRVYTELWRLTGDALAARVAAETAGFIITRLGTAAGGFAASLDADTGGVEGATYVWAPTELHEVLGDAGGDFAVDLFGVTDTGTFEHGASVLRLVRDVDDGSAELAARWRATRETLRDVRDLRAQPDRDDKVLAEWNGLAITALAHYASVADALHGGLVSRGTNGAGSHGAGPNGAGPNSAGTNGAGPAPVRPDHRASRGEQTGVSAQVARDAAVRAGELLLGTHIVDGRLRRVSRDGTVGVPAGVLADYACVAQGFATLYQATGDVRWLDAARDLLDTALDQFTDGSGGFHDTAADAEVLVARPADPTDGATPSGSSALCEALVTFTALTGETRYREAAATALARIEPIISSRARFAGLAAAVGEALADGPVEVAVVGATESERAPLVHTAIALATPGAVIVAGQPDDPGAPLLAHRRMYDGAATAYVCRGFVCDRPVTVPDALADQLTGASTG